MDLEKCPPNTRAGLMAMNADSALAPVENAGSVILQRYLEHESIEDIAKSYSITPSAVYHYLIRNCKEEWKAHQAAKAMADYDAAERELERADDGVKVSRAREQIKSSQWKLERVLRVIYGQDAPAVQVTVNLGDTVARIAQLESELLGHAAPLQGQSARIDESGQS